MRRVKWIMGVAAFVLCFAFLQRLFVPKYAAKVFEGNLIQEYYAEVKAHDVLFIGDCEVYENISPITLWEEYGIPSYIRGSAQQLIWQSYYLLEEALRYEKPRVVVFNVLAMQYHQPQREEYNRLTLDGMRLSLAKLKAVRASMMAEENIFSYLLPLLRYHDRWSELTAEDWQYIGQRPKVSFNGFMMRCDIRPMGDFIPEGVKRPDYRFGENSYRYLDKITQLCKDNDITLVLMKAPLPYPYWYPQWESQMIEYAAENDLLYINFLNYLDEIGLDYNTDTYNGGQHLNVYGAEKLARYFGSILQEQYALPDRRNEPETAKRWAEKSAAYAQMKNTQETEFRQTGAVSTFIY